MIQPAYGDLPAPQSCRVPVHRELWRNCLPVSALGRLVLREPLRPDGCEILGRTNPGRTWGPGSKMEGFCLPLSWQFQGLYSISLLRPFWPFPAILRDRNLSLDPPHSHIPRITEVWLVTNNYAKFGIVAPTFRWRRNEALKILSIDIS